MVFHYRRKFIKLSSFENNVNIFIAFDCYLILTLEKSQFGSILYNYKRDIRFYTRDAFQFYWIHRNGN